MALNKQLISKLQDRASKLGVAPALPKYITRLDPTSQNHIVYAASQEILMLEHKSQESDATVFANMINNLLDEFDGSVAYVHGTKQDE